MPDENEKIEDFMSLWKKKNDDPSNTPSVIGDTLNQMDALKKENQELRKKISENIVLISKTEEIIRNFSHRSSAVFCSTVQKISPNVV